MKVIFKVFWAFFLTVLFGILYYNILHRVEAPPEPNMFWVGALLGIIFYSVLNSIFILIVLATNHFLNKSIYSQLLNVKHILVEVITLYVFLFIISQIHIRWLTGIRLDLLNAFGPFILIYSTWLGIILLRKIPPVMYQIWRCKGNRL